MLSASNILCSSYSRKRALPSSILSSWIENNLKMSFQKSSWQPMFSQYLEQMTGNNCQFLIYLSLKQMCETHNIFLVLFIFNLQDTQEEAHSYPCSVVLGALYSYIPWWFLSYFGFHVMHVFTSMNTLRPQTRILRLVLTYILPTLGRPKQKNFKF